MTEVEKLDAEIVARAEALIDDLEEMPLPVMAEHLREAVAAKRAAMQPKPLSAEEALRIHGGCSSSWEPSASMIVDMAAVLRECRKRDLALIDKALADRGYTGPGEVGYAPSDPRAIVRRILLDGRSA